MTTMREAFITTVNEELENDPRIAVVTAVISASNFPRDRERVVDVGIREQTMVGVAGGLALAGLRPVVHSYAPFLVERPYEQIKLDIGHQDVGAVFVSIGASYDDPVWGRTHQSPGDVALFDTLPGWTVHVPGHADEVTPLLRQALKDDNRVYVRLSLHENAQAYPVGEGFTALRHGKRGVVLAVGPMLDRVLKAVDAENADLTVLYAATVRPFDSDGLRRAVEETDHADVLVVEPYLEGTSAHLVSEALQQIPHRVRYVGVKRHAELRNYGTAEDHDAAHDLDVVGLGSAVRSFFRG
ncbi:transketolase family protein [Lentzea flava]|uniref:Transketolase n=1 Tax=Lentzea flava TaxID=103732 RepID=A0ABQ2UKB2_9PSEU|nr:transketolase C-terminal domain-containing protein [Lentzea flava]MCP2199291.1 transketolase [Lentzea flava]GGU36288.1 transketolase [Lentzea flava]